MAMTSSADRLLLLGIAREAITAHVSRSPAREPDTIGELLPCEGAFVTLHRRGELRGCIGHLQPRLPIGRVVARCAVAACSRDPRFPPVKAAELPDLDIELSILGPCEPVSLIDEIEIGRHGLVAEQGSQRGLLLPQVATEWKWDRQTFVEQTCHKAGLPRDAWRHAAGLWKFEAEVFGERNETH
jgi:AmmeMemoRadiSam system protein A